MATTTRPTPSAMWAARSRWNHAGQVSGARPFRRLVAIARVAPLTRLGHDDRPHRPVVAGATHIVFDAGGRGARGHEPAHEDVVPDEPGDRGLDQPGEPAVSCPPE